MRFLSVAFAAFSFLVLVPVSTAWGSAPESGMEVMEPNSADLTMLFEEVQRAIGEGDYAEAGVQLSNLREHGLKLGYNNLPEFSWKLLERAELLASSRKNSEAGFLIRRAVELSPADARIRLTASSFYDALGKPQALSYLKEGLAMLPGQPSSAVPVLLNVLLVALVAFTLAFFMTCLVQVIVNSTAILKRFNRRLPVGVRGLFGPVLLAAILGAPVFGGLLAVVGCWSLILSRCVRSCRWLGIGAGALALAWWFCIPVLEAGGGQSREPINRSLENVRNNSLGEFDRAIVTAQLKSDSIDPLVVFTLGLQYLRAGELELAEKVFQKLQQLPEVARADTFRRAALINLGVIEYQRANLDKAMQKFRAAEEQGADNYELFHNMAIVALAQVDTAGHREYYNKARERADERAGPVDESTVLTVSVPLVDYYLRFLKPVSDRLPEQVAKDQAAAQQLFSSLMLHGSPMLLFCWSMALLVLGLVNLRSLGASRYLLADGARSPALFWAIVPGGYFGAGRHPGSSIVVLGLFMLVVMLALGEPNIHYEVIAGELPLQEILLFVAAGIVILQGGLSVMVAVLSNSARSNRNRAKAI